MTRTPQFLAVVVVAVAAALLGVTALRTSGDDATETSSEGEPGSAPVSAVARACPAFGTNKVDATGLSVGNVTLQSDSDASGGSNKATSLPGGKPVKDLAVNGAGTWASGEVGGKTSAVALNAAEALAPFSTGFAATRPDGELGGGLAMTQCPQSQSRQWFVGAGSTANHPGTLVLTNPTDIDAVVDVAMYGGREELEVVGGSAVVVEPGQSERIPLDKLGTGEDELGVEVHAARGTIAASVLDGAGELNSYQGSEYLPAAARPSKRSVIGGVPPGSDKRQLLITNPNDSAANVSVTVVGKDGAFTPSGLESVTVGSGSIKKVDLPRKLGKAALSIRLQSKAPITGAVRLTSDGDVAYVAANEPFSGPVAVPTRIGDSLDGADLRVAVTPASHKDGASIRVRAFDAEGSPVGKEAKVDVSAGTTASFDPLDETNTSRGKAAYVTLHTSGAKVRAAATYRDGDDMGTIALAELPSSVVRPAVSPGVLQ